MSRVQSLGEYQDPVSLVGEVKLEEGTNIRIDRDDSHNSLIITDTRPPAPGIGSQLFSGIGPTIPAPLPSPILTVS